jgi:DNA polymerase III subunit chi
MTQIEFYTGVTDPVVAAHRLALKVFAARKPLRIATSSDTITNELDRLLWEQPEDAFVPHVRLDSPLRAATSVVIDHANTHEGDAEVLISLCAQPPSFFARFERMIEIVGRDEASALAGRERWQFYKARGYALTHTDLSRRTS